MAPRYYYWIGFPSTCPCKLQFFVCLCSLYHLVAISFHNDYMWVGRLLPFRQITVVISPRPTSFNVTLIFLYFTSSFFWRYLKVGPVTTHQCCDHIGLREENQCELPEHEFYGPAALCRNNQSFQSKALNACWRYTHIGLREEWRPVS